VLVELTGWDAAVPLEESSTEDPKAFVESVLQVPAEEVDGQR